MNARFKNGCYLILFLFVFTACYFAARIPLMNEALRFEEGIFAELMVHRPAGPAYALSGRIDGENFYNNIQHPAGSYEMLRIGGTLAQKLLAPAYLDDPVITPRLRLICSAYQYVIWIVLAVAVSSRRLGGMPAVLILLAAMLSPLAIETSVKLQIDNTAGVVFCGAASILFLLSSRTGRNRTAAVLLFAGAFAASLGKQEWSFTLLAAVAVVFVLIRFGALKAANTRSLLWAVVGGAAAGNLLSMAYDPVNYFGGAEILSRFCNVFAGTSGWNAGQWLSVMKARLPFVSVNFILQGIFIFFFSIRRQQSLAGWLLFVYGSILFAGFLMSDWNYEMRYFAPSLVVLATAAISGVPALSGRQTAVVTGMAGCVLVTTILFLLFFSPNANPDLEKARQGLAKAPNAVYYLDSGAAWNKPEIDYVNNNSPFEQTSQVVYERFGKKLVRPEQACVEANEELR